MGERKERFLELGNEPMPDYFEHNFEFFDAKALKNMEAAGTLFHIKLRIWMDACGTGSSLWSCGLLLGECLWHGLVPVRGKRVLELGCGCAAVPSIVASHLGADNVVATDLISEVLESAMWNTTDHKVEVRRLDWCEHVSCPHRSNNPKSPQKETTMGGAPQAWLDDKMEKADVVLWSDAVYTEFGGFLLAQAALAHIRFGGVIAAVVPEKDRAGMDMYEQEMHLACYERLSDCQVPKSVFDQAERRFAMSTGLTSITTGAASSSRLVFWEA